MMKISSVVIFAIVATIATMQLVQAQQPCGDIVDGSKCLYPRCTWDSKGSKCHDTPCNKLPLSACPMPRCARNVSGSMRCSDTPCYWFQYPADCAMRPRCEWRGEFGMCAPKPCDVLFASTSACDPDACRPSWDAVTGAINGCEPKKCEEFSGERCPVEGQTCHLMQRDDSAAKCVNATCRIIAMKNEPINQTTCEMEAECSFINNKCMSTMVLSQIPCGLAEDQTRCEAAAPAGRCVWNTDVCQPAQLADSHNCSSYTDDMGSKNCPERTCGLVHGFCLNPTCGSFRGDTNCKSNGCLWLNPPGKCFDPQVLQFPCKAIPRALCPLGRCSVTTIDGAERCVDYFDPESETSTAEFDRAIGDATENAGEAVQDCTKITNDQECASAPACMWDAKNSKCMPPACEFLQNTSDSCDPARCRLLTNRGTGLVTCVTACPAARPFICPGTRACGRNIEDCDACSSSDITCPDGSCAPSFVQCPCPMDAPHRCGKATNRAGACVPATATANCDQAQCGAGEKLCHDSTCVPNAEPCPCPPGRERCPDGSCRPSAQCAEKCPAAAPWRCKLTGECTVSRAGCACDFGEKWCPTLQRCVRSWAMCTCPAGLTRCPDRQCAKECIADCTGKFRCMDGTCANRPAMCRCPPDAFAASARIDVKISSSSGLKIPNNRFVHIGARARVTACGAVRMANVSMTWILIASGPGIDSAKPVFIGRGSVFAIPPFRLKPFKQYKVFAIARLPIPGQSMPLTASASVQLDVGTAPPRALRILGGDEREVSTQQPVGLRIDTSRLGRLNPTEPVRFAWQCLRIKPDGSKTPCPDAVVTQAVQATQPWLMVDAGVLPVGNYSWFVSFRGVTSRPQRIAIVDRPVMPAFDIIGLPTWRQLLRATGTVTLYVRIPRDKLYVRWMLNGSPKDSASYNSIEIGLDELMRNKWNFVSVVAVSRENPDMNLHAKARFFVPTKLMGNCIIERVGDFDAAPPASTAAGQDLLRIKANFAGALGEDGKELLERQDLRYRFVGILDGSDTTGTSTRRAKIPLTPFATQLPRAEFRAPVLRGNPATGTLHVMVLARSVDSPRTIGMAKCSIDALTAADAGFLQANLRDAKFNIAKAKEERDEAELNRLSILLQAAADAANAAGNKDEEMNARRQAAEAIRGILPEDGDANALSRTQRSAVLQNALGLVTRRDAGEADADKVDDADLTEEDEADLLDSIRQAVNISRDGADAEDALDAKEDGPAVLSTLDRLKRVGKADPAKAREIAASAIKVALALAAQASRGDRQQIGDDRTRACGMSRAGDDMKNATLEFDAPGKNAGKVRLPEHSMPDMGTEGDTASVAATVFKDNHLGENGKGAKEQRGCDVVDITLMKNGKEHDAGAFSDADPAIIELPVNESMRAAVDKPGTKINCVWFDHATAAWSKNGVSGAGVSAVGVERIIRCNTTHFSTFTVFIEEESTTTTTEAVASGSDSAAGPTPPPTTAETTAASGSDSAGGPSSPPTTAETTAASGSDSAGGPSSPPTTAETTAASGSGAGGPSSPPTTAETTAQTSAGSAGETTAETTAQASGGGGATTPPPTPPPTTAATTAATTKSAGGVTTVALASMAPGEKPPGVLRVTLKKPAAGETTAVFDTMAFRKKLAEMLGVPEMVVGVSEPDTNGVVTVALLGANQTEMDAAVKKAEKLDESQLNSLGASAIADGKAPPEEKEPLPLYAIIVIAVGGVLLIGLIIFFVTRKKNEGTGQHTGDGEAPLASYEREMAAHPAPNQRPADML